MQGRAGSAPTCQLVDALRMLCNVSLAPAMPCPIASSKLLVDSDVISMTLAIAMLISFAQLRSIVVLTLGGIVQRQLSASQLDTNREA